MGDRDGTEEGYQDTDLFVDESVDHAAQAIQNLLLEALHKALLQLSPAERDFILSYYEMKIPNATCLYVYKRQLHVLAGHAVCRGTAGAYPA